MLLCFVLFCKQKTAYVMRISDRSSDVCSSDLVGANELVISMPWRDEIISNPTVGAAHGGIVSALIDLTGRYTIIAMGGAARATADLHVDFHRPAKPAGKSVV